MKKKIFCLFFTLLAALLTLNAAGADYSFKVPREETIVMLEPDGSMSISVEYEFQNLGQALDFVDIGLPNDSYSLRDIQVKLNGEVNTRIKVTKADYSQSGLLHGITLEMGSDSIPKGGSGTVEVIIPNLGKNIFDASSETVDENEVKYVGFQFSPNYFGKKYVSGSTDFIFTLVYPVGTGPKQVYYYSPENWPGPEEPDAWISEDDRVVYRWKYQSANAYSEYTFGGKYPKDILTTTANIVVPSTSSSGSSDDSFGAICGGFIVLIGICAVVWGFSRIGKESSSAPRSPRSYLPPQIKSDGEGIKRGLTAVEAAILLELDLERVISMILYGLSKKEVIAVKSQDPFEVDIADPLPSGLHDYELGFIEALKQDSMTEKKKKMRDTMHRLILSVTKKVEGFSLKETREYYKNICDKAWSQVEAAETNEMKSKLLGDNFGWAMLEAEPEKKIETVFSGYDMMPPSWWWRVDPGYRRSYSPDPSSSGPSVSSETKRSSASSSSSSGKPVSMPVLPGAMFIRSITDSARGLGTSMVGNMSQFKSTVKNKTNPEPVRSYSSGGHSSGGGSSCACACACASCACACAGGGR